MKNSIRYHEGFSTVTLAMLLMFIMTMITLISSHTAITQQRISGNDARAKMTFDTADGGIDQTLAHLNANKNAILIDNNNDGTIDPYTNAQINNVTMANGSTFSAAYSNQVNHNFNQLDITVNAFSDDGTATKTAHQLVALEPFLIATPEASLIAKGNVNITGNLSINNTATNLNIWSGGTVALDGSCQTTSDNSGSDRNGIGSDVVASDAGLSSLSADNFFNMFFGTSKSSASQAADVKLTGAANYSSDLNGAEGKFIWIDVQGGDTTLNANTVIGSAEHPVILVVDGNLRMNGGCQIYGMVYTTGLLDAVGTADVYGAVVTEANVDGAGTPNIFYDHDVLNNLQSSVGNYTKVAGSWRDF